MSGLVTERNIYATQFSEIVDRLPGRGVDWLDRLRKSALERFVELGSATTRLEHWKYTNVAPIGRITFRPALSPSKRSVPESLRSQLDLFPSPRLVFVDGMLDRNLSPNQDDDCGLQMSSLAESLGD